MFQFWRNQPFCLFDFCLGNSQGAKMGMVEFLLVMLDGSVAIVLHIIENTFYRSVELRYIEVWALYELTPFFLCRILHYLHSFIQV